MGWVAIVEMIVKFIPTLINIIMSIIKAVKPGTLSLVEEQAPEDQVCDAIDKIVAELCVAKEKLQSEKVV